MPELRERAVELLELGVDELSDHPRKTAALRSLGTVCLDGLNDSERSAAWWEALLENEPRDLEAIARLDDIYLAAEAWDELSRTLEHHLEFADGLVAANLSCRLGRLVETVHGDQFRALEYHQAAFQRCDGHDSFG